MRRLRPEDITELEQMESIELHPYHDEAGWLTIGIGHKLTKTELAEKVIVIDSQPIEWRNGLTSEQVSRLLAQDLSRFERCVQESVTVPLNDHQFCALVSFCFNVGESAFRSSTLLKRLNAGRYEAVPTQLRQWVYVTQRGKKVVSNGLRKRREAEVAIWSRQP